MLEKRQRAVDVRVPMSVCPSPPEEQSEADQDPAEAELEIAQHVDWKDERERLGKLDPRLRGVRDGRLRLVVRLQRGREGAGGARRR